MAYTRPETVNGKGPDPSGNIVLGPADIGAAPPLADGGVAAGVGATGGFWLVGTGVRGSTGYSPSTTTPADSALLNPTNARAVAGFTLQDQPVALLGGKGRLVIDGVTTSGSTTVTSATALFTAADVGRPITGPGIPAVTYIAARTSATSVTLSTAATVTASGVSLTIAAGGYEHLIQSAWGNNNVMAVQNLDPGGFNVARFLNAGGAERGAVGAGQDVGVGPAGNPATGAVFLEASAAVTADGRVVFGQAPPVIRMFTTGRHIARNGGRIVDAQVVRSEFRADGTFAIQDLNPSGSQVDVFTVALAGDDDFVSMKARRADRNTTLYLFGANPNPNNDSGGLQFVNGVGNDGTHATSVFSVNQQLGFRVYSAAGNGGDSMRMFPDGGAVYFRGDTPHADGAAGLAVRTTTWNANGVFEVNKVGGLAMYSADGSRWLGTISNTGALTWAKG